MDTRLLLSLPYHSPLAPTITRRGIGSPRTLSVRSHTRSWLATVRALRTRSRYRGGRHSLTRLRGCLWHGLCGSRLCTWSSLHTQSLQHGLVDRRRTARLMRLILLAVSAQRHVLHPARRRQIRLRRSQCWVHVLRALREDLHALLMWLRARAGGLRRMSRLRRLRALLTWLCARAGGLRIRAHLPRPTDHDCTLLRCISDRSRRPPRDGALMTVLSIPLLVSSTRLLTSTTLRTRRTDRPHIGLTLRTLITRHDRTHGSSLGCTAGTPGCSIATRAHTVVSVPVRLTCAMAHGSAHSTTCYSTSSSTREGTAENSATSTDRHAAPISSRERIAHRRACSRRRARHALLRTTSLIRPDRCTVSIHSALQGVAHRAHVLRPRSREPALITQTLRDLLIPRTSIGHLPTCKTLLLETRLRIRGVHLPLLADLRVLPPGVIMLAFSPLQTLRALQADITGLTMLRLTLRADAAMQTMHACFTLATDAAKTRLTITTSAALLAIALQTLSTIDTHSHLTLLTGGTLLT